MELFCKGQAVCNVSRPKQQRGNNFFNLQSLRTLEGKDGLHGKNDNRFG